MFLGRLQVFLRFLIVIALVFPPPLRANPSGGQVVAGQAGIAGSGNTLTIQQLTNNAIINWRDFSINLGELTKFIQPSELSAVLNRVVGGNLSAIYGTLQANGKVFLINPNGVLVGPSGVINTQSFVASTLDVNDGQFMRGGNLLFSGKSLAGIKSSGKINALGGDVFLIAHTVQNSGEINASGGTAGLAAGSEVLLKPAGNERVFVRAGSGSANVGVDQVGQIRAATAELKAAAGNVYAIAVNNGGVVSATGAAREGGRVYLRADSGTVLNSGVLQACQGDKGGEIYLLGGKVGLTDVASVDVSGQAGGGAFYMGGGDRGSDPTRPNASQVYVGPDVRILANATRTGDGGHVVVWSDNGTQFCGNISARGGIQSGGGGYAEVSGKGGLDFQGLVDLRAPQGALGTLLLDPRNVTISNAATSNINSTGSPFSPTGDNANLKISDLEAQLALSNVIVNTGSTGTQNGDITVANPIAWTGGGANSLSLIAAGSVFVNAAISNALGNGAVTLQSGTGSIQLGANITTTGGTQTYTGPVSLASDVTLASGGGNISFSSTVNGAQSLTLSPGAGNITFGGSVGVANALTGLTVNGTGTTTLNNGSVTTNGNQTYNENISLGANADLTTNGGNVVVNGTVDGADGLTIDPATGNVTVGGTIGGTTPLNSLVIAGLGTTHLNASVSTTGSQTYDQIVSLGANSTLKTTNSAITFAETVDGANSLTANSGTGVITLNAVGSITPLTSLTLTGPATLNGSVTTTGPQVFNSAVTVAHNDTLTTTNSNISFAGVVNGTNALTLAVGTGNVNFSNGAGTGTPLTGLTVNGSGLTTLQGTVATASGVNQTYNEALTLGGDTTLSASGAGTIALNSSVNGTHGLTLNSVNGNITLGGAVGNTTPLTSLTVNNTGSSLAQLKGGSISTTGAQSYNGPTVLSGDTTLTTTNSAVTFGGTLDGANNLTVNPGTGNVTFSQAVGGTTPLVSLTINGSGNPDLNGGVITTTGAQSYSGNTILSANTTLNTTSSPITFLGTVNGADFLTLNPGSGNVTLGGAVGNSTALTSLTVNGSGVATLSNGNVTTSGNQTYNESVVSPGLLIFHGADIAWNASMSAAGMQIFGTNLLMGGPLTTTGSTGVLLSATNAFKNLTSSAIILPGGGRFLIYSSDPALDVLGGLTGSQQYSTTFQNGPSVGFSGNGFLYAVAQPASASLTGSLGNFVLDTTTSQGGGEPSLSMLALPYETHTHRRRRRYYGHPPEKQNQYLAQK